MNQRLLNNNIFDEMKHKIYIYKNIMLKLI